MVYATLSLNVDPSDPHGCVIVLKLLLLFLNGKGALICTHD